MNSLLLLLAHLLLRRVLEDVGVEAVHHVHRRLEPARLALEPNRLLLDLHHLQQCRGCQQIAAQFDALLWCLTTGKSRMMFLAGLLDMQPAA